MTNKIMWSKKILGEALAVFMVVFLGMLAITWKQLIYTGIAQVTDVRIWEHVLFTSIIATVIVVGGWSLVLRFILALQLKNSAIDAPNDDFMAEDRTIGIFLSIATIYALYPLRPIIQDARFAADDFHLNEIFVRYSGFETFLFLLPIAVICAIFIIRRRPTFPAKRIAMILIIMLSVVTFNSFYRPDAYSAGWYNSMRGFKAMDPAHTLEGTQLMFAEAKTDKERSDAHGWRAVYYNSVGKYEEAIKDLELAAKYDPSRSTVYAVMYLSKLRIGDLDGAAMAAEQCLKMKPRFSLCLSVFADYLFLVGETERGVAYAELAYETSLNENGSSPLELRDNLEVAKYLHNRLVNDPIITSPRSRLTGKGDDFIRHPSRPSYRINESALQLPEIENGPK